MMENNKIRNYIIIMLISVVLNFSLYYVAHIYHLPMWMDSVGTVYAAVMLEPAAGLLVGFATNFFQSAVIYGVHSLVYYLISAVAALSFGITLRKNGYISLKRMPKAVIYFVVFGTIAATLLTMWVTNGIPDSNWERFFYEKALNYGIPQVFACMWGSFVLKAADGIIIAFLTPILYGITPSNMVTGCLNEKLSWRAQFLKKSEK